MPDERLIVALDVPNIITGMDIVNSWVQLFHFIK